MQFTATGVVPQVSRCLTLEPKVAGDLVYVLGATGNELGGSEYYDLMGEVGLNVPTVEPRGSLKLYKALEEAISDGLLASCHGIYRGGLAVHSAMAAFAGSFGMILDLERVPQKECAAGRLRDDQVLFSETCGRFLVTVSPTCRAAFEARFQGLPCARVGEVTQDPRLVIRGQKGDILVEESLASLKRSWKQGNPAAE
jgi:phosphoribosylformylglycinamidine synthase